MWENSREFMSIGVAIARNRKALKDRFERAGSGKKEVTYA